MMYSDETYYLFYSSSWVTTSHYKVGVAAARGDVLSDYTKSMDPVIQTRPGRLWISVSVVTVVEFHSVSSEIH